MQQYVLQIIEHLEEMGYKKLNPESNNVYGRLGTDAIYVVVLGSSRDLRAESLQKFNRQIIHDLSADSDKRIELLNILLTPNGLFDDSVNEIVSKMNNVWLFSEDYGKLYVFENQPIDFDGLQPVLDKQILQEKGRSISRIRKTFGVITPILILINIIIFVISVYTRDAAGDSWLEELLADNLYDVIVEKQYYRIITSTFYHFSLIHLFSNMVVLVALGARVENLMGRIGFLISYLFCGIVASICSLVSCYLGNYYTYAGGASGAICGLMGVLIVFAFFNKGHISGISLKDLLFLSVLTILNGYVSDGIDNAAHVGGLIAGLLVGIIAILIHKAVVKDKPM